MQNDEGLSRFGDQTKKKKDNNKNNPKGNRELLRTRTYGNGIASGAFVINAIDNTEVDHH